MKPSCRKFAGGLLWTVAGLAVAGFVLGIVPWFLTRHPQHGLTAEQRLKARNDVRATVVQTVAGLALAGGLIVTYRTYRQNREEQDRTYRLRQAEQVNEVYTKAVEQLGHERAPVRLGALFSLEELAQHNPTQRQTVVNVLCAYLRMPYTPPDRQRRSALARAWSSVRKRRRLVPSHDPVQELQVRKTAQRILAKHLKCPRDVTGEEAQRLDADPNQSFWPRITLDLDGAALVDFTLNNASVRQPNFSGATFTGPTVFKGVTYVAGAAFDGATFNDYVLFEGSTFGAIVGFSRATFHGGAKFSGATFTGPGDPGAGIANFYGATFIRDAKFDKAIFNLRVWFGATFKSDAYFGGSTFHSSAEFGNAIFGSEPSFENVQVLHLDRLDLIREWPSGWSVRPDQDNPTRGTLHRSAHR